ncbi:MAG: YggT family protein [Actinomycetota bacterium]
MAIVCFVLFLYTFAILGAIILSWFPLSYDSPMRAVDGGLRAVTEPVLGPLRRTIPPLRIGAVGLDLSPIIVILGISILRRILGC